VAPVAQWLGDVAPMTWEVYGVGPAHSLVGRSWQNVGSRNRTFRAEDLRNLSRQGAMGHSFYPDDERHYDVVIPGFEDEAILCAFPGCENKRRPTRTNQAIYCLDHATQDMRRRGVAKGTEPTVPREPRRTRGPKKLCSVPHCGRPRAGRGLCNRCYQRARKGSPQWTPEEDMQVITVTIYDHRKV
jgi:hypothetical protein